MLKLCLNHFIWVIMAQMDTFCNQSILQDQITEFHTPSSRLPSKDGQGHPPHFPSYFNGDYSIFAFDSINADAGFILKATPISHERVSHNKVEPSV